MTRRSDNILVSIILPTYNGERFLSQSIESCIYQTYLNLELIIVDDGSTDSTLEIAKGYAEKDSRIHIISNKKNKNLPASLNIGHEAAKGAYISWTSDDNFYHPQAMEKMVARLQGSSDHDLVFTDFYIIDENQRSLGSYNYEIPHSVLLENIVRASFLYRREVYERTPGYDEDLFKIEDYSFWLWASKDTKFDHIPELLYYYRRHNRSLTAEKTIEQFVFKKEYFETVVKMYKKYFASYGIKNVEYLGDLFARLHLHQKIDVYNLLVHFGNFRNNIEKLDSDYNLEVFNRDFDMRIRNNILNYEDNQNFKTLLMIIRRRPRLLNYSKHRSLKILYKSLIPYIRPLKKKLNPDSPNEAFIVLWNAS